MLPVPPLVAYGSGVIERLTRLPLRLAARSLYALLKLRWFVTRPATRGAHAIPVTPAGRIVLIKLRYVGQWRVPGGGINAGEEPAAAAVRELREEIGLTSHGQIKLVSRCDERISHRRDSSAVFLIQDVSYAPRWTWEVEAVREFGPDDLPANISPRTRRWIDAARPTRSQRE